MDEVMDEVGEGVKGADKVETSGAVKLNGEMNGGCDESMEVSDSSIKSPVDNAAEVGSADDLASPDVPADTESADDIKEEILDIKEEEEEEMDVDSDEREVPNKESDTNSSEVPHTSNESGDKLDDSLNNGPCGPSNSQSDVDKGETNNVSGDSEQGEEGEEDLEELEGGNELKVDEKGDGDSELGGEKSDSEELETVGNDSSDTRNNDKPKSECDDKERTLQNGDAATPDNSEVEDSKSPEKGDQSSPEKSEERTPQKSDTPDSKDDESAAEGEETTPSKKGKGKKTPVPLNLTPRRSSRNLNKQKSYVEEKEETADKDSGSDIEEITMVDPLAVPSDLTRENKENSKARNSRGPNKTIVVNDTKHLVEIASGSKSAKGAKKEPTLVIIDTNSILSGRGPIPAPQQPQQTPHILHKPIQRSSLQITPTPHPSQIHQSYSVLPVSSHPHSQPQYSSSPTTARLPASSTITPVAPPVQPKPPIILPSLTDDMYVVEAPSFIVPYVYEKPPVKSLKDYIDVLQENIKSAKEAQEKLLKDEKKDEKEAEKKDDKEAEKKDEKEAEKKDDKEAEKKDDKEAEKKDDKEVEKKDDKEAVKDKEADKKDDIEAEKDDKETEKMDDTETEKKDDKVAEKKDDKEVEKKDDKEADEEDKKEDDKESEKDEKKDKAEVDKEDKIEKKDGVEIVKEDDKDEEKKDDEVDKEMEVDKKDDEKKEDESTSAKETKDKSAESSVEKEDKDDKEGEEKKEKEEDGKEASKKSSEEEKMEVDGESKEAKDESKKEEKDSKDSKDDAKKDDKSDTEKKSTSKENESKETKESSPDSKKEETAKDLKVISVGKEENKPDVDNKESSKVDESKKPASYFDNPLGKFFMQIGINLVQEYVQTDLLRSQKKKREREGGKGGHNTQMAISSLEQTLEFSKENNEPFHLKQKKCDFCNFKTESALVMAHHMETPHMRNYVYRCNFCPLEVRSPHDILFHMEAEHNVRGRLERGPAFHQCPSCSFEDNQKGKLTRHLVSCQKRYRPEKNQEPPLDWEPPAKIPRVSRNRPFPVAPGVPGLGSVNKTSPMVGQQHPLLPKIAPGPTLLGQTTMSPVGTIGRGRGRPPMQGRYVPDLKQAQVIQQQVARPMGGQPMRQGMLYRSSPSGPQSQVLLPASYHIGNQIYQNAAGKVQTSKVQQQPSISITPLPRQPSGTPPNAHSASMASIKPGHPGTGSKATFVICEICDGYIKDLEQLRSHMQWIHKVKIHPKMIFNRPPLNCQKCQFRFFTDQGLERHLLGSHGLVTSSMQEAANKGKDGGRCPVCGRVYQWKLLNHVARDHSMTLKPAHLSYKCTVCTATFGMYKQFENHVYTAHSVVAKRVMEKKPGVAGGSSGSGGGSSGSPSTVGRPVVPRPSTAGAGSQGDSLLKPLKINDEITIIPQPARARPGATGRPSLSASHVQSKGNAEERDRSFAEVVDLKSASGRAALSAVQERLRRRASLEVSQVDPEQPPSKRSRKN